MCTEQLLLLIFFVLIIFLTSSNLFREIISQICPKNKTRKKLFKASLVVFLSQLLFQLISHPNLLIILCRPIFYFHFLKIVPSIFLLGCHPSVFSLLKCAQNHRKDTINDRVFVFIFVFVFLHFFDCLLFGQGALVHRPILFSLLEVYRAKLIVGQFLV